MKDGKWRQNFEYDTSGSTRNRSLVSRKTLHSEDFVSSDQCIYFHCYFMILLTLRRLMSYIYMEHPFLMFLDHTQRRSTVGRTPLDE